MNLIEEDQDQVLVVEEIPEVVVVVTVEVTAIDVEVETEEGLQDQAQEIAIGLIAEVVKAETTAEMIVMTEVEMIIGEIEGNQDLDLLDQLTIEEREMMIVGEENDQEVLTEAIERRVVLRSLQEEEL